VLKLKKNNSGAKRLTYLPLRHVTFLSHHIPVARKAYWFLDLRYENFNTEEELCLGLMSEEYLKRNCS